MNEPPCFVVALGFAPKRAVNRLGKFGRRQRPGVAGNFPGKYSQPALRCGQAACTRADDVHGVRFDAFDFAAAAQNAVGQGAQPGFRHGVHSGLDVVQQGCFDDQYRQAASGFVQAVARVNQRRKGKYRTIQLHFNFNVPAVIDVPAPAQQRCGEQRSRRSQNRMRSGQGGQACSGERCTEHAKCTLQDAAWPPRARGNGGCKQQHRYVQQTAAGYAHEQKGAGAQQCKAGQQPPRMKPGKAQLHCCQQTKIHQGIEPDVSGIHSSAVLPSLASS